MKATALQLFVFNTHENRVCMVDGQPWFMAADFLPYFTGYSVTDCLKRHIPESGKKKMLIPTAKGKTLAWMLNYSGLLALCKAFPYYGDDLMHWLNENVLPVLRYDPKQQQTIERQAAEIEALKSDYALLTLDFNMLLENTNEARCILQGISETWEAKGMTLDEFISLLRGLAVDTNKSEFCKMLCECGYLMAAPELLQCLPTAKGIDSGLFALGIHEDESGGTHYETRITPEGMAFIVAYFSNESA